MRSYARGTKVVLERKMIPKEDMLRDIEISYDYLDTTEIETEKLEEMKDWCTKRFTKVDFKGM